MQDILVVKEMDKCTQEALITVGNCRNTNAQEVTGMAGKMMQAISKAVIKTLEVIGDVKLPDLPRIPAEIKKDIKHERNPMRLKQLNKELNESYKVYKR